MTLEDLDKYVNLYVCFDYAIIPPPWIGKNANVNNHIEGTLIKNNGTKSHYAIKEYDSALRDDMVGLIINFKVVGEELL